MDTSSITVRVLFFGAARDATGHEEIDVALSSPANTETARSQILSRFPNLHRFGKSLLFAVNQE
jgi:molybdopterin converting factor small subunit